MSDILTVIPTRGIVFTKHQQALEEELALLGEYPQVIRTVDVPLPESRNMLVDMALEIKDWKYLLLLDDDVIIPERGLQAMRAFLEAGNDIAIIDYPHHLSPGVKERFGVAVYEHYKDGDDVIGKEIAWAGLGCVLVKREAFEKMEKPYFSNSAFAYSRDLETGTIKFDGTTRNNLTASSGEDVYFYFNARKAGLKVAVVPKYVASHARIEKFVYRLAGGRYRQTHTIQYNDRIDRPEI